MKQPLLILPLLLLPALAAGALVSVVGSLTREYVVDPGHSYEGAIEVQNPSEAPQEIKVYQTDYFFSADGTHRYGDPGRLPRSNASWITLSPQRITIPAREGVTIRFTVRVPSDQTLTGSYWSVIMVEPISPTSPEASVSSTAQSTLGVREVVRYALQIVTSVGDTGSRQLRFSQIKLATDNEKRLLVVDLENTGERWLRPSLWVDLYDAKGRYVGKFDGGKHRLYPGTAARFAAELVGVASATYKALIVADCGGDDVFGANVSLVLKE